MAKMGRPRKYDDNFNWELFDQLCMLPSTILDQRRVVNVMNTVHPGIGFATIARLVKRVHKCTFDQYRQQKDGILHHKLLSKQLDVAMSGNCSMLIWLGKQCLDQKDQVDAKVDAQVQGDITYRTKWGSNQEPGDESK